MHTCTDCISNHSSPLGAISLLSLQSMVWVRSSAVIIHFYSQTQIYLELEYVSVNILFSPIRWRIKVVVAFLGSAWLTVICCIVKAVIDYQRAFTVGHYNHSMNRWSYALEIVIIGLSDQQIITGLSIIVGGLTQLGWGLESYHFHTIASLAWFSTITHLLTLTILRDEVRSKRPIRYFRLFGMGLLAVMLICISTPLGYFASYTPPWYSLPAWCLYHADIEWNRLFRTNDYEEFKSEKTYNWAFIAFTMGLLVYSFCTRAILLCKNGSSHVVFCMPPGQPWRWIESKMGKFRGNGTGRRAIVRKARTAWYKVLRANYVLIIATHELYRSRLWEVSPNLYPNSKCLKPHL